MRGTIVAVVKKEVGGELGVDVDVDAPERKIHRQVGFAPEVREFSERQMF